MRSLTGFMLAGRLGSLISFTIFIISSKLYFKNGPWYPGVGTGPSSGEEWEFCSGGKFAELISILALCVLVELVADLGPFAPVLVESLPVLLLCLV